MKLTETLSAWITIDGQPAQEYGVERSTDGRNTSCWIASELGKCYEITVEDLPTRRTSYRLTIDGCKRRGKTVSGRNSKKKLRFRGQRISATEIRPFIFSTISLSDDDTLLNDASSDLGSIFLSGGYSNVKSEHQDKYDEVSLDVHPIHERTKKVIDHQTIFGEPKDFPSNGLSFSTTITGGRFSFTFKYRPFAVLQAGGIAPRGPSPQPTVTNRTEDVIVIEDNSSSDEEELYRLKARKRELELEKIEDELRRRVKRKRSHRSDLVTKQEPDAADSSTKIAKRESQAMMEVIDLTSD